jgi:hypothetical protein
MLQLDTFNKLNGEIIFNNKKIQILQKPISVNNYPFYNDLWPPKKLKITLSFIACFFFLQVVFPLDFSRRCSFILQFFL